jgi:hypothetical protein
MAARFWVTGGDGNWNSTTNWSATTGGASGASVPGSADTAAFNANSGAGVATLDISPEIQTLTCTGFTGTLAFGTNTISLNSTGTIFAGSTTMAVTGTPQIICTNASATARTITPTAVTEANSISFRITAGTGTITFSSSSSFKNLDFTDGVNPTGYAGALTIAAGTILYGNLKASTGMTVVASANSLTFAATSGVKTIETAGVTFDRPLTFNGVGGTWQLQSALTSGASRTTVLTNGTLNLNGFTLTTGIFSSSNANARTIAFGTGNITLTGSGTTVLGITTPTNLTVTGTPTVNANYSGATGTRTFLVSSASLESQTMSISISAGTDSVLVAGAYRSLNFTGFSGTIVNDTRTLYGSLTISSGATVGAGTAVTTFAATSGTQTITTNGQTIDLPLTFSGVGGTFAFQDALTQGSTRAFTITAGTVQLKNGVTSTVGSFVANNSSVKFLQSTTPGSQATLSQASGTVNVVDLTIRDINAVGGASWNAYTDFENTDAGNNDGWNFSLSPPYSTAELPITLRPFTQPRRF